jgi:hypothetical protein
MAITPITLPEGSGLPSVGSILSIFTGSPGTYKPIGNISNLSWTLKAVTADTTNMGTPWKQHIITLMDAGDITGDLYFIPNSSGDDSGIVGHSFTLTEALGEIFATQTSSVPRSYTLEFPDGITFMFDATIDEFPIDMNVEKPITSKIKFGVTGEPNFTGV